MANKRQRIIVDIILVLVGIVFLIFGIRDVISLYNSYQVEDSVRFKKDYSYVPSDNVYSYVSLKETYLLLEENSGILFIASPNDSWAQVLAPILNTIAENNDMIINYLEIEEIEESSKYYDKVLTNLGIDEFESPYIVIFNKGEIVNSYNKDSIYGNTSGVVPLEYWTDENTSSFNQTINIDLKSVH